MSVTVSAKSQQRNTVGGQLRGANPLRYLSGTLSAFDSIFQNLAVFHFFTDAEQANEVSPFSLPPTTPFPIS